MCRNDRIISFVAAYVFAPPSPLTAPLPSYNPLAAGLLTGKHNNHNHNRDGGGGASEPPSGAAAPAVTAPPPPKGRFLANPNYLPRFYTGPNFAAVGAIAAACDAASLSLVEVREFCVCVAWRGALAGRRGLPVAAPRDGSRMALRGIG